MNATSQVPAWFDRQSARKVALLVAVAAALPRRGVVVLVPPRATISPAARARLPTRRPLKGANREGRGLRCMARWGLPGARPLHWGWSAWGRWPPVGGRGQPPGPAGAR